MSKKGINLADKNGLWKGDGVGYVSLHRWIMRRLKRPKKCSCCKRVSKTELCNISQNYKRDITDWEWLCRHCHMSKDGRLNNLIECVKTRLKGNEHWNWKGGVSFALDHIKQYHKKYNNQYYQENKEYLLEYKIQRNILKSL